MLRSGYLVDNFSLGAFYGGVLQTSLIPQLIGTEQQPENVNSDNSGFGFNISHPLPMRGVFTSSFTRSEFDTGFMGSSYNGAVDLITANAGIAHQQIASFGRGRLLR